MGSLSESEVEFIQTVVTQMDGHIVRMENVVRHFMLLFLDFQPGILLSIQGECACDVFCEVLDGSSLVSYSVENSESSLYHFYITDSKAHLDEFDPSEVGDSVESTMLEGEDNKHTRCGLFLGYPKEDALYYGANNPQRQKEEVEENVSDELFEEFESVKYGSEVALYIPAPNEAAVRRVINKYIEAQEVLESCDWSASDFVSDDGEDGDGLFF